MNHPTLSADDLVQLERAVRTLEEPGLAIRISHLIGAPIEKTLQALPSSVNERIHEITQAALHTACKAAVLTMDKDRRSEASNLRHKLLAGLSGAVGGAFGLSALAVELPVSTTIMLRSVADIARSEGEDLRDPSARLACVEVFALGADVNESGGGESGGSEAGYYLVRGALARSLQEAARHLTEKGLIVEGAPALIRFLSKVAVRFGVSISEKFAAQALPAIGAVGGAAVNLVFMDHYQDLAHAHFAIRRLERQYGKELIHERFLAIRGPVKTG